MNRTQNCTECKFMKKYDYGKEIYYCDNENRIDDMDAIGEIQNEPTMHK